MDALTRYAGRVPHPTALGFAAYRPANARGFVDPIAIGIGFANGGAAVGGPVVNPDVSNEPGGMIPFRRATTRRAALIEQTAGTITAAQQPIEIQVEGSGYLSAIRIQVTLTTATNSATVANQEDAPYAAVASVILKDVNGELVNVPGFDLYLQNLYGGYRGQTLPSASADTNVYQAVTGSGGTGGSARFSLIVPATINDRDLIGLLGNQDRAQKYALRTDIAASTAIWSTAPSNLPTFTIERTYESYAVPAERNANGAAQQIRPDKFGVLHFITRSVSPSAPTGGSTVNHYLQRLGNTVRFLILVLRSNGSRATAETNIPTRISFLLGDVPLFTESPQYRRQVMFERYGFDAPSGVFVYDAIQDFAKAAGYELGEDYWWTNGLANAQFQITYPAGFGSTNNSLTIITDDLMVPPGVDLYA